jgi:hypothetical protein
MASEDTTRDGAKKPKSGNDNTSNLSQPEESNDRIGMPNVDILVKEEIERLTKELIEDIRDIVLMDVSYDTIDFIPEEEIEIERPVDYSRDQFNNIIQDVQASLLRGEAQSTFYDYVEYLKMFTVRYNSTNGRPEITLTVKLDGAGVDDATTRKIKITRR